MKQHPEIREGEFYLGNFTEDGYSKIGWKTKRRGVHAYDIDGDPIRCGTFPVFAKKSELDAKGVTMQ